VTSDARDPEVLLSVRQLCKDFPLHSAGLFRRSSAVIKACHDVSFELARGQTLGVVGAAGSGKSTLARSLLRVIDPTSGLALFYAKEPVDLLALSERELRRVRPELQRIGGDASGSLNPRHTVQQILAEPLLIHRRARGGELEDRVVDMLRRVGLRAEARNSHPYAFSPGQRQRIGIARALMLRPSLVVADEVTSTLDLSVQAQLVNLLLDLQAEFGHAYLFLSRDPFLVRHIARDVAVLSRGEIVEHATTAEVFEQPRHAYTRSLLEGVPRWGALERQGRR
jgi:peptide/nickel transport system ATP-binding protein